jgi:acyl-CoA synthetase (AMP-forming)/AMP-acid ligase II
VHTHNSTLFGNREVAKLLELGEEDVIFIPSPVGHGTGYVWGIRLALALGGTAVLQDVWNAEVAATLIAEHGCTYTMAATTFAQDLLVLDRKERQPLDSLRYFCCGGASIPSGLRQSVRERFGWELLRLYGQTEAFLSTHMLPSDPSERRDAYDGRPIPGVEIRIVDDADEPCAPEEVGEVVARGPHRCTGFLRPEDADDRFLDGGWIRSTDLGILSEDGYLAIRGRKRDMINRGGLKYNPGEIEDVLHRHPSILRVSVVRVPDDRLGERGCAVVVPKDGCTVELSDLTEFLRSAGVAPYKWPERIELVEELPMTASGKVQKFVLEQQFAA